MRRLRFGAVKHHMAHCAAELGVVRPLVADQRVDPFEHGCAHLARKPRRFVVDTDVAAEVAFRRERFVAHVARVRSSPSGNSRRRLTRRAVFRFGLSWSSIRWQKSSVVIDVIGFAVRRHFHVAFFRVWNVGVTRIVIGVRSVVQVRHLVVVVVFGTRAPLFRRRHTLHLLSVHGRHVPAEQLRGLMHRPAVRTDKSVVRLPRVQRQRVALAEQFSALFAREHRRAVRQADMLVEVRAADKRLAADGTREPVGRPSLAGVRRFRLERFEHLPAVGTLEIGVGGPPVAQERVAAFERRRAVLTLKAIRLVVGADMTAKIRRRGERFLASAADVRLLRQIRPPVGRQPSRLAGHWARTDLQTLLGLGRCGPQLTGNFLRRYVLASAKQSKVLVGIQIFDLSHEWSQGYGREGLCEWEVDDGGIVFASRRLRPRVERQKVCTGLDDAVQAAGNVPRAVAVVPPAPEVAAHAAQKLFDDSRVVLSDGRYHARKKAAADVGRHQ